jgi:hypothetical protein
VEKSKLVGFKVSNLGNSVENFALTRDGSIHEFDYSKNVFYVDADNSGVLEESEKVDTALISSLAMDGSQIIWMEVETDAVSLLGKINKDGVMVEAVDASSNPYTASTSNDIATEDVVFADGTNGVSAARDGKLVLWYKFTTIENLENVKLDVSIRSTNGQIITYDPVNGTTNPMMIPGAKIAKIWSIKNNTSTTATNVKFSVTIDSTKETFSTNLDNTWAEGESYPTQLVWNNTTNIATAIEGVIDGDVITYTIPEIQAGVEMMPHLFVEVK